MTIDEAIAHCLEVAECNEIAGLESEARRQCCNDHRQLAEWLKELKELKNSIGAVKLNNMKEALELIRAYKAENAALISECDRLIKEKGELLKKSEQIAEYKRLLKAAVEDMNSNNICFDINACNVCTEKNCISCDTFRWRYTDEALKLIGGETNEQI